MACFMNRTNTEQRKMQQLVVKYPL